MVAALGASLFTEKYVVSDTIVPALKKNLALIFEYDQWALIQSFVRGSEYSVGCLQLATTPFALPAVKILTQRQFFGHSEKHRAGMVEEVPDTPTTRTLREISTQIFDGLGFANMCRFDFIVSEGGDVYFLEANPIPGLMRNSIFPKMLRAANLSIPDLIAQFMGGHESADLVIISLNFEEILSYQRTGNDDAEFQILLDAGRKIESAGARKLLICSNTTSNTCDQLSDMLGLEVINIIDATLGQVQESGFRRDGLLGTRWAMGEDQHIARQTSLSCPPSPCK
ncbi:hypothetical protein ACPT9H_18245 [Brevibacillus borstelensis]|uniref:hypothetical protein n=1 Tax=Brevibacillus borstelensis TaxID=45462 RepID=UPI003CE55A95